MPLLLEGLHTLFTESLRRSIDFSLYVDPSNYVRKEWKLKRDMEKCGYTRHQVQDEMEKRQGDYERYILPQKGYADVVIHIAFSRYGRSLGWSKNIYRTTLSQIPIKDNFPVADLALSLPVLMTRLIVEDDGPGIVPAHRDRLFEPYFSTKRRGSGLGLAIVHRIVSKHRGEVRVEDPPGGGIRFVVEIPGEPTRTGAAEDARPGSGG